MWDLKDGNGIYIFREMIRNKIHNIGEEFLILLNDVDGDMALDVAERIREEVENTEITVQGNVLKKTLSIGVSIFPKDSKNLWQCIKFSDVAMYKAKQSGRNRVVRFEPSMWTEENY